MNLRLLAAAFLTLAFCAAPVLRAQDDDKPKTPLQKDMDKISHAYKALRKQISDPTKNDSSLELLATIHDAAVAGEQETPSWTADQPAADRPKFVADFRAGLKAFVQTVDQASAALKAGDNAGAAKLVAQLGHLEHNDHKKFRKPEDE